MEVMQTVDQGAERLENCVKDLTSFKESTLMSIEGLQKKLKSHANNSNYNSNYSITNVSN